MSAELLYHGRSMNRDGLTLAAGHEPVTFDVLAYMLQHGQADLVYLEPGDGTRYTLLLAVVQEGDQPCLIVSRRGGGIAQYANLAYEIWDFDPLHSLDEAVAGMSNGNVWTAAVLHWWLTQLCEALLATVTA